MQNPNTPNVHAPLAGIVTEIMLTLSGAQTGTIDSYDVGTAGARLVLRWGKLHMTFTSAAQVQNLRGYFAMARQGMLKAPNFVALPVSEAGQFASGTVIAITWTATPSGLATIEQLYIPRVRSTITYVSLQVGNLTFRILDKAALDSVGALLERAHKLATVCFPDGHEHRANPTTASWHPHSQVQFARRGAGWIPRGK